jgi:hypothetical protein
MNSLTLRVQREEDPIPDIAAMTFRSIFLFISCLISSAGIAQQDFSRDSLLSVVEYLASDKLEGRAIGTEGSQLAREYIAEHLSSLAVEPLDSSYFQDFAFVNGLIKKRMVGVNVVGFIRGKSRPHSFLVVTSHYDHMGIMKGEIYNGADDNASGVAGMLAAAAHLSKNRPEHSVIFACFDGEESGLVGSRRFVEECSFPKDSLLLNVNMDMISRSKDDEINICGTYHYPALKPLLTPLIDGAKVNVVFGHEQGGGPDNWTYASDHANFHKADVPFLYFGVEDHEDYHMPTDDYENLDHDFYVNAVDFIITVITTMDRQL